MGHQRVGRCEGMCRRNIYFFLPHPTQPGPVRETDILSKPIRGKEWIVLTAHGKAESNVSSLADSSQLPTCRYFSFPSNSYPPNSKVHSHLWTLPSNVVRWQQLREAFAQKEPPIINTSRLQGIIADSREKPCTS
ncbi:hypothetical protein BDBG_16687 [Blastomyces gilchristii SLH14081]|uniref:Uncharacterized protein n=1 Tax=Blastomyces gilchristii (strain SLH14081) TaxID=559298 RepID=A0A179UHY4_BLAGS|nr:uncharacterized protein BDBG_16687 [Blastomyces gilchristii SLH14081]OAT06747.1 hypothetical protein BDBG_16687 [Blastomyces gilchristii SLH14081]